MAHQNFLTKFLYRLTPCWLFWPLFNTSIPLQVITMTLQVSHCFLTFSIAFSKSEIQAAPLLHDADSDWLCLWQGS